MLRSVMLPVVLALLIAALLPGRSLAAVGGTDLPLRGSQVGYMTVNLATGQAHVVTTGQISHLGSTTVEQDLQIVPTGSATRAFSGTWTMTVASGEQLFGTCSGAGSTAADGIHSTTVGHCVSTGGTGRLSGVSVVFDVTAQNVFLTAEANIATQATEIAAVGRMNY